MSLADHVRSWALPQERLFPLSTPNLVKIAALEFEARIDDMTTEQRLTAARNIAMAGEKLAVDVSPQVHGYVGTQLSPGFRDSIMLRKEATAHLHDDELDKLVKVASVISSQANTKVRIKMLDKVAWALDNFDQANSLTGHWGQWFPDPAASVYGREWSEKTVKVADYDVKAQDFENADWSRLDGKLSDDVVQGLRSSDDKLAVFASLPTPEREVIYQNLWGQG